MVVKVDAGDDNDDDDQETKNRKSKVLAKVTLMNSKREFFLPRLTGGVSSVDQRM